MSGGLRSARMHRICQVSKLLAQKECIEQRQDDALILCRQFLDSSQPLLQLSVLRLLGATFDQVTHGDIQGLGQTMKRFGCGL